jgi:hypothetical protein
MRFPGDRRCSFGQRPVLSAFAGILLFSLQFCGSRIHFNLDRTSPSKESKIQQRKTFFA